MRNIFVKTLIELAESNPRLMLLTGDLGYSVLEPFREKFPRQFLNVGIAEQNMAGIAAGLAKEGRTVFIYSIGNFPTLRCMEQIRYDICYHDLDVKIVAIGAGYAYGPLGASHHLTEDLGMLRTIPNLTIAAPGDPVEAEALVRYLAQSKKPGYLRINKAGERTVHKNLPPLNGDEMLSVLKGSDTAVLATGAILEYALGFIGKNKLNWSLFSCPFVNCLNTRELIEVLEGHDRVIAIEEHQLNAGFGSALLEKTNDLLNDGKVTKMPKVHRVGIPNMFICMAGSQDFLRQKARITLDSFL